MARPTSCLISKARKSYLKVLGFLVSLSIHSWRYTNDLAKEQSEKDYTVDVVVSPLNGEKWLMTSRNGTSLLIKNMPVLMDTSRENY